jgi:hypothetical protein
MEDMDCIHSSLGKEQIFMKILHKFTLEYMDQKE